MSDSTPPKATLSFQAGTRKGYRTVTIQLGTGQSFTEHLNVASSQSRDRFIERAVKRFGGLDPEDLAERLEAAATEGDATESPQSGPAPSREDLQEEADESAAAALEAMPDEVVNEATALLARPDLIDVVIGHIAAIGIVGEVETAATVFLCGTSRLLDKPLSAIVQGTSSSGKSYLVTRVSELFPPEAKLLTTDITPTGCITSRRGRSCTSSSWGVNVAAATMTIEPRLHGPHGS